jgi:hypothetical protein
MPPDWLCVAGVLGKDIAVEDDDPDRVRQLTSEDKEFK